MNRQLVDSSPQPEILVLRHDARQNSRGVVHPSEKSTHLPRVHEQSKRGRSPGAEAEDRPSRLTMRERELIELATKGLTDKEICRTVGLTLSTVRTHWVRLRKKLGVANRAQAIAVVVRSAMQTPQPVQKSPNELIHRLHTEQLASWIWQPESKRVLLSAQAKLLFGLDTDRDVMTLKRFLLVIGPADREKVFEFLFRARRCPIFSSIDHRVTNPSSYSNVVRTIHLAKADGPTILMASALRSEWS